MIDETLLQPAPIELRRCSTCVFWDAGSCQYQTAEEKRNQHIWAFYKQICNGKMYQHDGGLFQYLPTNVVVVGNNNTPTRCDLRQAHRFVAVMVMLASVVYFILGKVW